MEKKPKKKSWMQMMFCCTPQQQVPSVEEKRKKIPKIKIKGKIQLSLIGSHQHFKLCKISRKNVAIDGYKQSSKSAIPVQVLRYLRDKINATTAVTKGEISPTVTAHTEYTICLQGIDETSSREECLKHSFTIPKMRGIQLCIYRPTEEAVRDLKTSINSSVIKLIQQMCKEFETCILILPKEIVYDELGIVLSELKDKQVEIENIVINGTIIMMIVYVGSYEFIKVRQEQQIEFIIKQLRKDSNNETYNLELLMQELLKNIKVNDILTLLVRAINQAKYDTIISCFLRNLCIQNVIPLQKLQSIFPSKQTELIKYTPNIDKTASFGLVSSDKLSLDSFRDLELLNKGSRILTHQNEIETYMEEQFTLQYIEPGTISSDFKY